MSSRAQLSTPDPEFAAVLQSMSSGDAQAWQDMSIEEMRDAVKNAIAENQNHWEPHLPPESSYNLRDYNFHVDGDGQPITLRILVPASFSNDETYPVLVWFHGGSWVTGDRTMDDYRLRIACVKHRVTIVNIEYRLGPEHQYPVPWDDAYSAVKWIIENQSLVSGTLEKGFVLAGFSAGSNLAASVAARATEDPFFARTPITGHLLQCPVLLHPDAPTGKYQPELLSMDQNKDAPSLTAEEMFTVWRTLQVPPTERKACVVLRESLSGLPPLYIQVAGWDPLRDEGLLYARRLSEAGVETRVTTYTGVPHGFNFDYPQLKMSTKYEEDFDDGLAWLFNNTKGA